MSFGARPWQSHRKLLDCLHSIKSCVSKHVDIKNNHIFIPSTFIFFHARRQKHPGLLHCSRIAQVNKGSSLIYLAIATLHGFSFSFSDDMDNVEFTDVDGLSKPDERNGEKIN